MPRWKSRGGTPTRVRRASKCAKMLPMALALDRDVGNEPCGRQAQSFPRRKWRIPAADPTSAAELARALGTSQVVGQLLLNRGFGVGDLEAARAFIRPELKALIEPSLLPGCTKGAERIARALRDGERIVIYGDYDVDGITATAILWHALVVLGGDPGKIITYIPHRVDEGYGLNSEALLKLADEGSNVIVSVDCGITAIDEAIFAQEAGIDLILTDHHEWRVRGADRRRAAGDEAAVGLDHADGDVELPDLPQAYAIVHPRLPGSEYANPHLTGAGVAFKLAWEVGKQLTGQPRVSTEMRAFLVEAMALAALGTIADVAPLTGENRVIARFGLGGLTSTRLRGLRALIDSAGLGGQNLDSYHVGFLLGPRLNACGRMGHAEQAVRMLTTAGSGEARDIAAYLEQQNRQRQATERVIAAEAVEQIRDRGWDGDGSPAIVVEGEKWHVGVVGIVASRLVDLFHRPAVVLATENGSATGSGRSIPAFHLARALTRCSDLLESHGGHAMAAGVRLKSERIEDFRERLVELARRELSQEDLSPTMRADAEVGLDCIGRPLVGELERLGPYGVGNPKPLLVFRDLTVLRARCCGKDGAHLQLLLEGSARRMKAIAFRCGQLAERLRPGDVIDLVGEPSLNEWNGMVSVELTVRDLDPKGRA